MNKQPLSDFVKEHGQAQAAELLGLTQGGISKALRVGRQVFVYQTDTGYRAEEVKPFPSSKQAA